MTGCTRPFLRLLGLSTIVAAASLVVASEGIASDPPQPNYLFRHLAGAARGPGTADGKGRAAQFNRPASVALDAAGNLFVADSENFTIRKVTPDANVTTMAGRAGEPGIDDGIGTAARFAFPTALACDATGNLYVTDTDAFTVRKIMPDGTVSTLAGEPGKRGNTDGTGANARFNNLSGLAVDRAGNVFVADGYNGSIRKITPAGRVTTFAGSRTGATGLVDGEGTAARFVQPCGVAIDAADNLYVVDVYGTQVRKITPDAKVTTMGGADLRYLSWKGIAVDGAGNVLVCDAVLNVVRKIAPGGGGGTLAGGFGGAGGDDGAGHVARFLSPVGLATDRVGRVYVADRGNDCIRLIDREGEVATFAGSRLESGGVDGAGAAARFSYPNDIVVDAAGNLYVTDHSNSAIRKITPAGVVTTLAGTPGRIGTANGRGASALFNYPRGLGIDRAGNLYVADSQTIRKISPTGEVTTLAGKVSADGYADGIGAAARFYHPQDVGVDGAGNVYVADPGNDCIRKITPGGSVTTLAGKRGLRIAIDGKGAEAGFESLATLAVDESGNVYVPDRDKIRKVAPDGTVTTWVQGLDVDGLCVDQRGTIYATSIYDDLIYRVAPDGGVTRLAGAPGAWGRVDGDASVARFWGPADIAVDSAGDLYVAEAGNLAVRKGERIAADAPLVSWPLPAPIVEGTLLSGTELAATAAVPGVFTYSPDAGTVFGPGARVLTVTFTPADSSRYVPVSRQVGLSVYPRSRAGAYFGSVTSNGSWALQVRADNTGTFIAQLWQRKSAIVAEVKVDSRGIFTGDGVEIGGAGAGFALVGQLSFAGRVSGYIDALAEDFVGQRDAEGTHHAAFYVAPALGVADGNLYAIVGSAGKTVLLTTTPGAIEAFEGWTDGGGHFSTAVATRSAVEVQIDNAGQVLRGAITSENLPTARFMGLSEEVAPTTRLVNIATRAFCATGNSVTIGGFVIAGHASKRVLLRAVGPSLSAQGIAVAEVLADPVLEVHDANRGNLVIATNDNWNDATNSAEMVRVAAAIGAAPMLADDRTSSAALLTLGPGVYSFVVKGRGSATGVVLLEAYDVDPAGAGSSLVNIATRANATTGTGVTIGGFVVTGNAPRRVLLRAVGPSLVRQGLDPRDLLSDPQIELHDAIHGNVTIATNDNWRENANARSIPAMTARVGAAPLDESDTKSAVLLITLTPGVYSLIASGKASTAGIALIEVYDVE